MDNIRDLRLLVALARQKHFSRAAEECGISQPAFSARIRHIEDSLGLPIVRRGNKFLGFTRDGEVLLKWAHKILNDVEGMRQELDGAKGALRSKLVIGAVPTALSFAAKVSGQLRKSHPDLTIGIQSLTSAGITQRLADYTLDAGITYIDGDADPSPFVTPLYQESYVLIAPKAMAPRESGEATWKEAATLPLCLLTRDMRNRQLIDAAFDAVGTRPEPVMETNGFTAALAQVADGTAATIAPQGLAESVLAGTESVRLQLVDPVLSYSIGLVIQEQEPVLPAIVALQKAIRSAL